MRYMVLCALFLVVIISQYVLGNMVIGAFASHWSSTVSLCFGGGLNAYDKESTSDWLGVAMAVLLYPLVEEYFFRRKLIDYVGPKFGKPSAVLISSVIFSIAHTQYSLPPTNWGSMVNLTIAGCVYSVLYVRSGSLVFPVVAHVLGNAIILVPKPGIVTGCQLIPLQHLVLYYVLVGFILIVSIYCMQFSQSSLRHRDASHNGRKLSV